MGFFHLFVFICPSVLKTKGHRKNIMVVKVFRAGVAIVLNFITKG